MFKKLVRALADVAHHHPKGIPKVTDKIVWIYVIDPNGSKHAIPAYEGESMLRAIESARIEIPAHCRGGDFHISETEDPVDPLRYGPACSECQIEVGEPWVHYMKPMGIWEKDRLVKSATGFSTPNSRLACCFTVEKWMNGIQISIPLNLVQKMEYDAYEFEQGENIPFKN
jgi:ferredoxin